MLDFSKVVVFSFANELKYAIGIAKLWELIS
jgi:hypothetical protein